MKVWKQFMRPGDWASVVLTMVAVVISYPLLWQQGAVDKAVIRRDGVVVAEFSLDIPRIYSVTGPIGMTEIEIQSGRARVLSDPGPHQYCVKQGWLMRPNAIAICAPNHISLALVGRAPIHDSLTY
jgi:hypothetical protein